MSDLTSLPVLGRPVADRWSAIRAILGERSGPAVGRVAVLFLTLGLVALQPGGEPWWYSADSDATYLGSALNLLLGRPTRILEHPALPLQILLTLSLGIDYLVRGWFHGTALPAYVDACFANLDQLMWIARAWGLVFLLGAVTVAYEVGRRCLGHWLWGVVAACLYLAMPGHVRFATMLRPENQLSSACLLSTYLMVRAVELGSPNRCLMAAILVGYAVAEKVHAVGMLLPLAGTMLILIRQDWSTHLCRLAQRTWHEHSWRILFAAAIWFTAVIVLNKGRAPATLDWKLVAFVGAVAILLVLSIKLAGLLPGTHWLRVLISPAYPLVGIAVAVGLLLPATMFLDEIRPLFWSLANLLSGRSVNSGVHASGMLAGAARLWSLLVETHMVALIAVAGIGAVLALRFNAARRAPAPGSPEGASARHRLWLLASLGMLAPVVARSSLTASAHYLAPSLTLLIPPVMLALSRPWSRAKPQPPGALAWLLVGLGVIAPYVLAVHQTWDTVARGECIRTVAEPVLAGLQDDEAVLMNYGAMNDEANYMRFVIDYCDYAPPLPVRAFPDTPNGIAACNERGLRPAYYMMAGSGHPRVAPLYDGGTRAINAWQKKFDVELDSLHPHPALDIEVYRILPDCLATQPFASFRR